MEGETIDFVFVFFFSSNWVDNGKREGEEFEGEVSGITCLSRHGRNSERGQLWPWYIWNYEETPQADNMRLEGYRIRAGGWRGKYTKDQLQWWLRTRRMGVLWQPLMPEWKKLRGRKKTLRSAGLLRLCYCTFHSEMCSSWGPLVLWIQYCTDPLALPRL